MRRDTAFSLTTLACACLMMGAPQSGWAQWAPATPPGLTTTVACASSEKTTSAHLYGRWNIDFYAHSLTADGQPVPGQPLHSQATLVFEKHPEHADSLIGTLHLTDASTRATHTAQVSGDLEDSELILDESDDGTRISAVWVGRVTLGGCGKRLHGTRRLAGEEGGLSFILTKTPGWQ